MGEQSYAHDFASTPSTPSQTITLFLNLPYEVRREIYALIGFIRPDWIDMNNEGVYDNEVCIGEWSSRHQKLHRWPPRWFDCCDCRMCYWCNPLANQLFYVCRAISKDARPMFYSQNKFKVSYRRRKGLLPLKNLSPTALRSLGLVAIQLNAKQCLGGYVRCHGPAEVTDTNSEEPLGNNDKAIISDWKEICARLAPHIKPYHLGICLICDAAERKTAEAFLNPLLELPRLKDCSIRLLPYSNGALQRLVERAIRQATERPAHHSSVFRFTDLPREIQLQILEHTDLVAPTYLTWKADRGSFVLEECVRNQCGASPRSSEISSFCPSTHVGYSSVYTCCQMPVSLFRTSRAMTELARYVFYSRNVFGLQLDCWPSRAPPSPTMTPWKAENSQFLRLLPADCVKHLRYLEWKFPEMDDSCFLPDQQGTVDWINTLDFIARNVALPKLTLILDLSYDENTVKWRSDETVMSNIRNKEIHEMKWSLYKRVVEPVVRLRGLKDLFVHVSWPLARLYDHVRDRREQILERRVMGDDYNSRDEISLHT